MLNQHDKIPTSISLRDAYTFIITWLKEYSELEINFGTNDEKKVKSTSSQLIQKLSDHNLLSDIEIIAILHEVCEGNLNVYFHNEDGKFKLGAYAQSALEASDIPSYDYKYSNDEIRELQASILWPYLATPKTH